MYQSSFPRELRRIPTDSFKIEVICKPEIPEHEPEHLIGKGNNRYFKYPIISKVGYDFGIDYNNSNAFATSMWDWKTNTFIVGEEDIRTIGQRLV